MKNFLSFILLISIVFFAVPTMAEEEHGYEMNHEYESEMNHEMTHEHESEMKIQTFQFDFKSAYIEKGALETNLFSRYLDDDSESSTLSIFELEYCPTDRFKVSTEIPYEAFKTDNEELKDQNGLGDIEFGGSFAFLKHDENKPEASIGVKFISPTGDEDKGLGKDAWGWKPFLRVSKTWEKIALHGRVAYEMFNNAKEEDETVDVTAFVCNASIVYMPTEQIDLILELSRSHEKVDAEDSGECITEFYVTPGIKYDFGEGLEAGLAVPIGLYEDNADWGVMVRINKAFEVGTIF